MSTDLPVPQARGHRELAVHGLPTTAWLGRLVEEWFAGRGRLAVPDVSYRGTDSHDEPVTGTDGDRVALQVWTASADGTRTTIGTTEVELTEGAA